MRVARATTVRATSSTASSAGTPVATSERLEGIISTVLVATSATSAVRPITTAAAFFIQPPPALARPLVMTVLPGAAALSPVHTTAAALALLLLEIHPGEFFHNVIQLLLLLLVLDAVGLFW